MPGFEPISLHEWWNGRSSSDNGGEIADGGPVATSRRIPIVDLREFQHDDGRRLIASCSNDDNDTTIIVNLPLSTLLSGERSCELPPRHVAFAILIEDNGDDSTTLLEDARSFFGATSSNATKQSRKPWVVPFVLIANDTLWNEASQYGMLKIGATLPTSMQDDSASSFQPQSRLWQPDSMIESVLWPLLKERASSSAALSQSACPHSEEVWDLGSGAGRDVCFLAEQAKSVGMTNYRFVGIDNHKGSMKRCLPFWKHRNVQDYTEARNVGLHKIPQVREEMNERTIACLYAVRFWNAKLVEFIAIDSTSLKSGSLFCISHFCKPYLGAPWDYDHPKEKSVLDRNQLRNLFERSNQWKVIHDEISYDGDHGRTLIQFVAKKL